MASKHIDYIIVGQGIAGSVLSFTLLQHNQKILVIDSETLPSSSKVAAGIFNPITGKRLAKSWQADLLFPFLKQFYTEMERMTGKQFLHLKNFYRPYISVEEQNSWIGKTSSPALAAYTHTQVDDAAYSMGIQNPYGGLEIKQAGYVDVKQMLEASRMYLQGLQAYQEEIFDYRNIVISKDEVSWKGIKAKKIIFCEGTYNDQNPYFNWLPFKHVKGELLTVRIPGLQLNQIINRGIFILPLGKDIYKVGATYKWDNLNWQTTQEARQELTDKLTEMVRLPFEVVEQEAGIRPASLDRRPFIGLHPEYASLGIFNGLGTKGISIAPYYAKQFFEYLETNKELEKDTHINRYFSLYYKSKSYNHL